MAKTTFSNEQLCRQWIKVFKAKGTRRDVVLALMGDLGIPDDKENYRKVYNNVTQRVKQLGETVVFPALTEGKKGARRTANEVASLQAIMAVATEAPATEGEAATVAA